MDRDIISQGSFYVPHFIYDKSARFNKSQKAILFALFALQDKYLFKTKGCSLRTWFNVSNRELCRIVGIAGRTLTPNRLMLVKEGWIEFKRGYSGRNSDYRIIIDNFYLANKHMKEQKSHTTKN